VPEQEIESKYADGLPLLDPIEDMNIGDPALASAVRLVERLERELAANPIEAMQRNPSAWSAQVMFM